jgi:hypothetical protein
MKRSRIAIALSIAILSLTVFSFAKDKNPKPGPLTGTWQCMSHGGPNGDMAFTLYLEQQKETVTGSVSSPIGDTEITSASFKKKNLEVHIDSPQGSYLLTAKLKKNQLAGDWSIDTGPKGTWEGKKSPTESSHQGPPVQ